jgi:hypothetical protein
MIVLRNHRNAFGYTMAYLKGISPTIAMHRIIMEEGAKPIANFHRKLKTQMKELVIEEIIRLLSAGIIYSIHE